LSSSTDRARHSSGALAPAIEIHRHSSADPWTYRLLDQRQRDVARRVREGGPGALLISEIAPVITVGRRTPETDLLLDEAALAKLGIERLDTDRGGLATYHGPGQWVVYPVDRLDRLTGDRRGVRKAVEGLLRVGKTVAEAQGLQAEIREGAELGVWSRRGKIASVGIHIEGGVLLHGLSLNVYRTAQSFIGLKPCGLEATVDFLNAASNAGSDEGVFNSVKNSLIEAALGEFWL